MWTKSILFWLLLVSIFLLIEGKFGGRRKDDSDLDEVINGATRDPQVLKDAMRALKDPSTMREVEKLMSDPAFIKEMERLKTDAKFASAVESAKSLYNDADRAAKVFGDLSAQAANRREAGVSDAQLGMSELSKAAKDPQMLVDAMQIMQDPEIAMEVNPSP